MSARKSHGRFRDDIYRNALILEFFAISRVFSDTRSSIYRIDFTCEFLE